MRNARDRVVRDLGGDQELADSDAAAEENAAAGSDLIQQKTSVALLDRVVLRILKKTTDRLIANPEEVDRFFQHYFGASLHPEELVEWIAHFKANPPHVGLGYPNESSRFPGIYIILESDSSVQTFVGDYGGETIADEAGEEAEYLAEFQRATLGLYVYAMHPDVCSMLYHYGRMMMLGASAAFSAAGAMDRSISGGELSPQEAYIPQNMFLRVVRVELSSALTVPQLKDYERASRLRTGGIYVCDVVVDGMVGGVHPTTEPR